MRLLGAGADVGCARRAGPARRRARGSSAAAVSIAALCELAEESAGGGKLEELRRELVALRVTERPEGIEEAETAALALEQTILPPPRLATAEYLDAVGAAVRRLELALGDSMASPFAEAMTHGRERGERARARGSGRLQG